MFKKMNIFLILSFIFCHSVDFPTDEEIIKMNDEEKNLLYQKHKINPYKNTLLSALLPTIGHYRIHKWWRGFGICVFSTVIQSSLSVYNRYNWSEGVRPRTNEEIEQEQMILRVIVGLDIYFQTEKYNDDLYKKIFNNN